MSPYSIPESGGSVLRYALAFTLGGITAATITANAGDARVPKTGYTYSAVNNQAGFDLDEILPQCAEAEVMLVISGDRAGARITCTPTPGHTVGIQLPTFSASTFSVTWRR